MCNAKVYVGTYGKYNGGSIAGGWIALKDCKTYDDFIAKCRALHRDEQDPEFMIQDAEDFPDGLSCMEWLSKDDFETVKADMMGEDAPSLRIVDYSDKCFAVVGDTYPVRDELKRLGAWKFNKFLKCGAGWLFPMGCRADVEAWIATGTAVPACETKRRDKEDERFKAWLDEYIATQCKDDPSDAKYYRSGNVGALKIGNEYFLLPKPGIENRFCFHDEGPDYEFYKSLMADDRKLRDYFIRKNEGTLKSHVEGIEKGDDVYIETGHYRGQCTVLVGDPDRYYHNTERTRKATEEERTLILEGFKYEYAKFHKRLETYLAKYGTSKLHTWTYWADR